MPIVRTYGCRNCGHVLEITLTLAQADDPPPRCPVCRGVKRESMQQEFKPVAIGGSTATRARDYAQTIANEDYHVADIQMDRRAGSKPVVRYKDQGAPSASTWSVANDAVQAAITAGRASRQQYGDGLDILHSNLKDGTQPDLIEVSKRRAMRIW